MPFLLQFYLCRGASCDRERFVPDTRCLERCLPGRNQEGFSCSECIFEFIICVMGLFYIFHFEFEFFILGHGFAVVLMF